MAEEIDENTKRRMDEWSANRAKYNAEFEKLLGKLPSTEARKEFDDSYRSLFLRVSGANDLLAKLDEVSNRLGDSELNQLVMRTSWMK